MNAEKLKKLQAQAAQVRIGGKGTPRRKKKVTKSSDEKFFSLKIGSTCSFRLCTKPPEQMTKNYSQC